MSDNRRRSPSPSVRLRRADDTSDEPMSHQDRDCRRSDKRRAPRSPSPRRSRPPSREGRHEKRRRVTAHDASPSPDWWCATTTGLLLHDRDHRCPTCLEYQKHVSLDIVLETLSIMDVREDCLRCLARCRGGLGVAAASGEARSTQGLLEVWQSSQGLGKLGELGRVVVVQSLQD